MKKHKEFIISGVQDFWRFIAQFEMEDASVRAFTFNTCIFVRCLPKQEDKIRSMVDGWNMRIEYERKFLKISA